MTKSKWIQLSGWGLAASGFLLMAGLAASGRPAYNPHNAAAWPIDPFLNAADFIMAVTGLLLLGAGMAGLLARFGRRSGWLGRLGLAIGAGAALVSAAGAAGLQVVDASPWWDMFITGLGASCMGLALFGAAALRERPFRRWNGLPLAVGLLLPVLMLLSFGLVPMVVPLSTALAVFIIFSAGLALVGYRLQSEAAEGLSAGAV